MGKSLQILVSLVFSYQYLTLTLSFLRVKPQDCTQIVGMCAYYLSLFQPNKAALGPWQSAQTLREREGARTQSSSLSDLVRSDLLLFLPLAICNGSKQTECCCWLKRCPASSLMCIWKHLRHLAVDTFGEGYSCVPGSEHAVAVFNIY